MELWDGLDENGQPTGKTLLRGNPDKAGEFHLVVHIWLFTNSGKYLIQKRAEGLDWEPGKWAATGGSVISGEESLSGALRETKEELGLTLNPEKIFLKCRMKREKNFADIWFYEAPESIIDEMTLAPEVTEVKWVFPSEIFAMIEKGIFHNYGEEYFRKLGITSL